MLLSGGVGYGHNTDDSNKSTNNTVIPSSDLGGIDGNLEYVKLLNNPLLTVRITTPKLKVITGALSRDFQFNLGNEWRNLVSISSIPLLGDLNTDIGGVLAASMNATQGSMEALWMTSAAWSGYKMPEFPIEITFLNYSPSVNLFNHLLDLSEGMLPPDLSYDLANAGDFGEVLKSGQQKLGEAVKKGTEQLAGFINPVSEFITEHKFVERAGGLLDHGIRQIGIAAPFNYGLEYNEDMSDTAFKPKPRTTFALEIGNWFAADKLLMSVGGFSFSKEILPNGSPITLSVSLTFRPYRNISFKEFAGLFKLQNTVKSKSPTFSYSSSGGKA